MIHMVQKIKVRARKPRGLGKPDHIEVWWDGNAHVRSWGASVIDKSGNHLGEVYYVYSKEEALRNAREFQKYYGEVLPVFVFRAGKKGNPMFAKDFIKLWGKSADDKINPCPMLPISEEYRD